MGRPAIAPHFAHTLCTQVEMRYGGLSTENDFIVLARGNATLLHNDFGLWL